MYIHDALKSYVIVTGGPGGVYTFVTFGVIALVIVVMLLVRARDRAEKQRRRQLEDRGMPPRSNSGVQPAQGSQLTQAEQPAAIVDDGARSAAWASLFQPTTTAEELASVARNYPEFAPQIALHANCYPELRAWAARANESQ